MKKSKLLFTEKPLIVNIALARVIGLNEAIVIQQLDYRLNVSKNYHSGKKWVYRTLEEWQEELPFFSRSTIQRILRRLKNQNILLVQALNTNHWNRTNWYSIDYQILDLMAEPSENSCLEKEKISPETPQKTSQNDHMHVVKMTTSDQVNLTTSDMVKMTTCIKTNNTQISTKKGRTKKTGDPELKSRIRNYLESTHQEVHGQRLKLSRKDEKDLDELLQNYSEVEIFQRCKNLLLRIQMGYARNERFWQERPFTPASVMLAPSEKMLDKFAQSGSTAGQSGDVPEQLSNYFEM